MGPSERMHMRFEDLDVWQRARQLSADVYKKLDRLHNFGFRDQITRSALSIPSNIAEGFERESAKECLQFLSYAKGSCGELRTQIYIGMDVGYIDEGHGQLWLREAREISSMISGLIKTRRRFLKQE
jgi:four helix bundle protein